MICTVLHSTRIYNENEKILEKQILNVYYTKTVYYM